MYAKTPWCVHGKFCLRALALKGKKRIPSKQDKGALNMIKTCVKKLKTKQNDWALKHTFSLLLRVDVKRYEAVLLNLVHRL